ncbi:hypothetical protein BGZ65_005816 [Modicella reniformis]|uniref:Uncharacterized protein n=1 Tax=Modicella reniformis TaxID=1440133 RepID=A0A9P6IK09_9FUNG|nr:hypothetical protein BGZ65_005816 [Modicella reniformis]
MQVVRLIGYNIFQAECEMRIPDWFNLAKVIANHNGRDDPVFKGVGIVQPLVKLPIWKVVVINRESNVDSGQQFEPTRERPSLMS